MASSKLVVLFLLFLFFFYNIVVFNVFYKHRGKYAKPDFEKFISLEINYFVGAGCFYF